MPKLFCISDVHGFFDEMLEALNAAGFDETNPEHWLIGLGDYFDRGRQPVEVMRYLHNLPRKVLVRGNHEKLLVDCCERGDCLMHDIYNGTSQTIVDIGRSNDWDYVCDYVLKRTRPFLRGMVNYFETQNYIFVHSWIPLNHKDDFPDLYIKNRKFDFDPNWREATQKEWDCVMWYNPFELAGQGLLPDKKIVFGHFHTSYARHRYEDKSEFGDDADFSPYYGNGYIGIDGCTAYSGKVNCLVLEDGFLEDWEWRQEN